MIQIKWQPSNRDLRVFAIGQIFFVALILTGFLRRGGSFPTAAVIMAVSSLIGLIGVVQPVRIRWIYLAWMIAVFPIGWCLFQLMLTAVFVLAIMPIGFLLKILRIDPLTRRFDHTCPSYWTPRKPMPPASRYFRQF